MPKPDPYTVLGVPKDAPPDVIRQAHRRKAKRAHRDAGGNDDEMRQVNEAWMILRDPARRQHYDETGKTEERDTSITRLIQIFIAACDILVDHPEQSPIEVVQTKLVNMRKQTESAQRDCFKKAGRHRKSAKRIKTAGQNLLKEVLENHAANLERRAAELQEELDEIAKMKVFLDAYSFEAEGKKPQEWSFTTSSNQGDVNDMMAEMMRQMFDR